MKRFIISFTLLVTATLFIFSCAKNNDKNYLYKENNAIYSSNLVTAGYTITDSLIGNLKVPIDNDKTIIVASFVNINNLEESSTLGRMLSETISSRFSQMGYKVIELKLRKKSIYMEKEKGEFLLSRDMRVVTNKYNAAAIVAGTYGESSSSIFVSAKIINPVDNFVLSSTDHQLVMHWRSLHMLMR